MTPAAGAVGAAGPFPSSSEALGVPSARPAPEERRVMAIFLPDLLDELAVLRVPRWGAQAATPGPEPARARGAPRAVVLTEFQGQVLEPDARLDAVNGAARQRGVSPRQTIARATAIVESLVVLALPLACVTQALKRVAEAALSFGSPVAFRAPDTVWVDVSGTRHLFGGEHELGLALVAHVRAMGHSVRVASAPGPWLAQSFARHADFDATGLCLVEAASAARRAGLLPIGALPISSEAVAWFSRLGLLCLDDLRKLPTAALAARLESPGAEHILDLIQGKDDEVLAAYLPEELPVEEQSWDCPLESVEPLLFVLKGLAARLASRLEGRGQAAQELLLCLQYDKASVDLRDRERRLESGEAWPITGRETARENEPVFSKEIPFRLASPLSHAEDLERIVRSRLQRETLSAPCIGLRLQVTVIAEARQQQLALDADAGLAGSLSSDPRAMAVLVAELSADIGEGAVGVLETQDSHLPEKSSCFVPIGPVSSREGASRNGVGHNAGGDHAATKLPTRLVAPIELISPIESKAPLQEKEIVVLGQRAYVVESIVFEQRLEAIEWWEASPVSRDYFRLWLSSVSSAPPSASPSAPEVLLPRGRREGLEVLVYKNRRDGKKYVQAFYD